MIRVSTCSHAMLVATRLQAGTNISLTRSKAKQTVTAGAVIFFSESSVSCGPLQRDDCWTMFSNLKSLEWHRWRDLVAEGSTLRSIQDCGVSSLERFGSSVKRELESRGVMGCTWSGLNALTAAVSGGGGEVFIGERRFRIQRQVGEGGFAFVYLVKEVDEKPDDPFRSEDGMYAIKKFLIQSEEQRVLVKQEIEVSKLFDHPNLLHLLDSDVISVKNETPGSQEAYLLFPFHRDGTLLDHLTRMQSEKKFFPTITVLYIFKQICEGLKHMHTHDPPYAHYDMKPGNVLLSLPRNKPPVAVIMDFGSASPARKQIHSRKEAMVVQEWASQHCTAPYRAPELWDTPSETLLDERIDIWALGCTLYAIMYGMSPFEYALNEQGGSLHLAIISGFVKWPPGPSPPYPESLHSFVQRMVNPSVESRPFIQEVCFHVDELIEEFSGVNKGDARGLWPLKTES